MAAGTKAVAFFNAIDWNSVSGKFVINCTAVDNQRNSVGDSPEFDFGTPLATIIATSKSTLATNFNTNFGSSMTADDIQILAYSIVG